MGLAIQRERLRGMSLDAESVERALEPLRSFQLQLAEEIDDYERVKRGELGELENLRGLGHVLVKARVALGLSQRKLAARLGVDESQVSRDERNEYHGVTVERASRVLDAMGVNMKSVFEEPVVARQPRKGRGSSARRTRRGDGGARR